MTHLEELTWMSFRKKKLLQHLLALPLKLWQVLLYITFSVNFISVNGKLVDKGLAQIIVEDSGQNSIVIVPGANNCLTSDDVNSAKAVLTTAKIMLTVLEIPREVVLNGLRLANELGGNSWNLYICFHVHNVYTLNQSLQYWMRLLPLNS